MWESETEGLSRRRLSEAGAARQVMVPVPVTEKK